MRLIIILALLVPAVFSQVKFGQLCSGNRNNLRRGCDCCGWGCGHYDAPRNGGRHKGIDIACKDGDTVYAPFDLTLTRKSSPYRFPKPHQKIINNGVAFTGAGGDFKGLCVMMFYLKPDKIRGFVKKGQRIGVMLPMQKAYPRMTSHTHVQLCNRSNPTKYF